MDAEQAIKDPADFEGMEHHRAAEALVAAKLSRGLERPRIETEGRFARAIRLADAYGTYRQKLEARYEQIWTAFWWFDDFQFLNDSYDDFESRALQSDLAKDIKFLGNLNQLLVNSVVHSHMPRHECRFDERTSRLTQALEAIAYDPNRPNNSLEAQTALLRIRLSRAMVDQEPDALPAIWRDFAAILEKAKGLGEFDADELVSFIEIVGEISGNDPAYNDLVENLADFVASRKSEAEGALILLKRAKNLDFSDRLDMIRWLGKAAVGLTKREYAEHLIEAVKLLALAYRSAGLPWAARASCVLAAASLFIEGEERADPPVSIIPTMKMWAWNALERCHLPDFLLAIQFLNGFAAGFPLTEESKARIQEDIRELDLASGCLFLNLEPSDLRRIQGVPDILEALGLFMARTALLYALGYADVLRKDGSLPKEEVDDGVKHVLSILKSQPVAESLRGSLILNEEVPQTLTTTILGMKVEVAIEGTVSISIAEAILGSLEAFFATVVAKRVVPHTELFRITVTQSDSASEPHIATSELDMTSAVTWPRGFPVARLDQQHDVRQFLSEVAAHVMGATCLVRDINALLDSLYNGEALQQRMSMIAVVPNSYNRITSRNFSCLADWKQVVGGSYPLRNQGVEIPRIALPSGDGSLDETDTVFEVNNHRRMDVSSVIDMHAWDQARWQGCGYLQIGPAGPPYMVFLFENTIAARKIFERWRIRFGENDRNEQIAISIVRNLPDTNPHHYCVQIASTHPKSIRPVVIATKSMIMEPASGENLDRFLVAYQRLGFCYLLPGVGRTNPEFFFDLTIKKQGLSVKSAAEVSDRDIESLALRAHRIKFSNQVL